MVRVVEAHEVAPVVMAGMQWSTGDDKDRLVVWRLDRLGRSLHHLVATVRDLQERGVGFRSLTESIDTTTATGRLIFHVFGAVQIISVIERELISERTTAGLASARARGRRGGRP